MLKKGRFIGVLYFFLFVSKICFADSSDQIKARILDTILNPDSKMDDSEEFLFQYQGKYFFPSVIRVDWKKTVFHFNPLKFARLNSKPIELTPDEKDRYAAKIDAGNKFRESYFKNRWSDILTKNTVLGVAYKRLEKILAPFELPFSQRANSSLTRQQAEIYAKSDFEMIYGTTLEKAPLDFQQLYPTILNRYEIFFEGRRAAADDNLHYHDPERILTELIEIEKLLNSWIWAVPNYSRLSRVTPDSEEYELGIHSRFSNELKKLIIKIKEILKTQGVPASIESARVNFRDFDPIRIQKEFDDRFGLYRATQLVPEDFIEFIRSIKWWGLSKNFSYWREKDLRAINARPFWLIPFPSRVYDVKTNFKNAGKVGTAIGVGATKMALYATMIVAPLLFYFANMPSDKKPYSSSFSQSEKSDFRKYTQEKIEKLMGFLGQKDQLNEIINQENSSDGVQGVDPDFKERSDVNKDRKFEDLYAVAPLTQKGVLGVKLPFIFRSDIAYVSEGDFSGGYRIVSTYRKYPKTSKDSDIRMRSFQRVKSVKGKLMIPTPMGFEISAIDYGKNKFQVEEDLAGHFYLRIRKFVEPYKIVVEFRAKKNVVASKRNPVLDSLDRYEIEDITVAELKNIGFLSLAQPLQNLVRSGRTVSVETFTQTLAENSIYSLSAPYIESNRGTSSIASAMFWVNLWDQDFVGHCQDGNAFAGYELKELIYGSNIFIQQVDEMLVNEKGNLSQLGHRQIVVTDRNGKLHAWLDATPRRVTEKSVLFDFSQFEKNTPVAQQPDLNLIRKITEDPVGQDPIVIPTLSEERSEVRRRDPFIFTPNQIRPTVRSARPGLIADPPNPDKVLRDKLFYLALANDEMEAAWLKEWRVKFNRQIISISKEFEKNRIDLKNDQSLPHVKYLRLLFSFRALLEQRPNAIRPALNFKELTEANVNEIKAKYFKYKYGLRSSDRFRRKYTAHFTSKIDQLFWGPESLDLVLLASQIEIKMKAFLVQQRVRDLPVNLNCTENIRLLSSPV